MNSVTGSNKGSIRLNRINSVTGSKPQPDQNRNRKDLGESYPSTGQTVWEPASPRPLTDLPLLHPSATRTASSTTQEGVYTTFPSPLAFVTETEMPYIGLVNRVSTSALAHTRNPRATTLRRPALASRACDQSLLLAPRGISAQSVLASQRTQLPVPKIPRNAPQFTPKGCRIPQIPKISPEYFPTNLANVS
mgnify:CR=1 FL=1